MSTNETKKNLERIYPELNLEKWAIWQPASSRNKPGSLVLERNKTLPDGSQIVAKVKVSFTDEGALTTEDQKVYYALIKIWEENGKLQKQTQFSLRQIAKTLKRQWGAKTPKSITQSLLRLRSTLFIWTNSYYDSNTKETIELLDTFNILSVLKIARRTKDGKVNKDEGYFQFYDLITNNILNNYAKPLLFEVVVSFQSEIAQVLYRHLDLIMANKNHYERKSEELFFEDLRLDCEGYKKPSIRKRVLEKALDELRGVPLSSGILSSAIIQKTKDGKDYKIIFHKNNSKQDTNISEEDLKKINKKESKVSTSKSKSLDLQINNEASEIVNYFYKTFHGTTKLRLSTKEINQAVELINEHGYELSKYIIDFSHLAAPRTNYKPQTFGGILQYEAKAVDDYKYREEAKQKNEANLEAERRFQEEELKRIDIRLNSLDKQDYQILYNKVREDLINNHNWLKDCNEFLEVRIKIEMNRELEKNKTK